MTLASTLRARPVPALPLLFTALLGCFALLPQVRESARLFQTFLAAPALLLLWTLWLWRSSRTRALTWHFVLRRPHWLQPLVQLSIYLYWGWHWRQVYDSAYLIVAQIGFAYAFDMLLFWSRGDDYELGFGVLPIVLSMNLFLWFKPDWFYWQFVLVAAAFAGKQLLRWRKDGRLQHIFNPSSFPLAIASVLLIVTRSVDHTWGEAIVTTIGQPLHMVEFLFLISIPGQLLFGVTAMTMPAVLTTFLLSLGYYAVFGTYYFFGTIPAAVFIGMLLLVTDPATAPRSELGRILFGILYGLSVFVLYGLLQLVAQTTFYEKLLFVPILNLGVRYIDRVASSPALARFDTARLFAGLTGRRRNAAWLAAWTAAFACVVAFDGMGDTHPGNRLPFWERACQEDRRNACAQLDRMEGGFCERGSGWACNELALRAAKRPEANAGTSEADRALVRKVGFARGCALGLPAACANVRAAEGALLRHQPPRPEDYEVMLESKLLPREHSTLQLWQWACDQGWREACGEVETAARSAMRMGAAP